MQADGRVYGRRRGIRACGPGTLNGHVREESSALYAVGGSIIDIPRDVDDDDAPISLHEERRLQPSGSAIVKKTVIPVLFDQFRNDDCDLPAGTLLFQL